MNTNWNLGFSQLLRDTHPGYWGNWTLDATVQPGAVGTIDPSTGAFRFVDTLPGARTSKTSGVGSTWVVQSTGVKESQASIDLDGTYTDPETGVKVEAGLKTTWSFAEAGSITSQFTLANQQVLDDFGTQIMAQRGWLTEKAASLGMAPGGNIAQGFGVVTSVVMASAGLNIGAHSESSSFAIEGSVDATKAMAGEAGVSAKGSYAKTEQSAAFESHLWPAKTGMVAEQPIPIAFEFASFVGDGILPGWVTNVSGINIQLDNAHGGTYIVDATAHYTLDGTQRSVAASVSGGLSNSLDPIPPEATDLTVDLSFAGMFSNAHHHFSWPAPLGAFPTGQIVIDLSGVWPGDTTAKERNSGAVG